MGASNRGRKYNPKAAVTADNVAQNAEYPLPTSYLSLHLLTLPPQMDPIAPRQCRARLGRCNGYEIRTVAGNHPETHACVYKTSDSFQTEKGYPVRSESGRRSQS